MKIVLILRILWKGVGDPQGSVDYTVRTAVLQFIKEVLAFYLVQATFASRIQPTNPWWSGFQLLLVDQASILNPESLFSAPISMNLVMSNIVFLLPWPVTFRIYVGFPYIFPHFLWKWAKLHNSFVVYFTFLWIVNSVHHSLGLPGIDSGHRSRSNENVWGKF